jgi:methionine-rich copper-binding protein CopC
MMRRRSLLAIPAVLAAAASAGSPARAHATLRSASPSPGSLQAIAPPELSIVFSEALEPRFSRVEVRNADAVRVDRENPRLSEDGKRLTVGLKPLAPGIFTVLWKVTSVDTHQTEGSYRFTITG